MEKKYKAILILDIRSGSMRIVKRKKPRVGSFEIAVALNITVNIPDYKPAELNVKVDVPETKVAEMVSELV